MLPRQYLANISRDAAAELHVLQMHEELRTQTLRQKLGWKGRQRQKLLPLACHVMLGQNFQFVRRSVIHRDERLLAVLLPQTAKSVIHQPSVLNSLSYTRTPRFTKKKKTRKENSLKGDEFGNNWESKKEAASTVLTAGVYVYLSSKL